MLTSEQVERILDKLQISKMSLPRFAKSLGMSEPAMKREINKHNPSRFEAIKEARRCSKDKLYRRGRSFEYQVANYLKERGWIVIRSPQSKSPTDLVAIRSGSQAMLVQCKLGSSFGPSERNALSEMAKAAGAKAVLATRPKRGLIQFMEYERKEEINP